jgi:23S rRNA (cytosine1962-C5)-methyltransferase
MDDRDPPQDAAATPEYPMIRILQGEDRRLRSGSPWLYSNELKMDEAARAIPPGSVVRLMAPSGKTLGLAHFNPRTLIAARLLTRNKDGRIDRAFVERRIARALQLRSRLYPEPYYRLVHAEADGLPGLVVDRFGDALVVQANTAGMAALEGEIAAALDAVVQPRAIVARDDTNSRQLEGLPQETRTLKGEPPERLTVRENGVEYVADPLHGQKTGWFYDQRPNRAFAAGLAPGEDVLDLYTYAGGFALAAAKAGARRVTAVDSSEGALALARESAERNALSDRVAFERADVFAWLGARAEAKGKRFGLVIADPPAFVKSRRDLGPGLRGYRKLAAGAAALVNEPGILCLGCCSYHVSSEAFMEATWSGIREAGRGGRLLQIAGAGPDHPVHPSLPESAYLKFLVYALD